MRSKSTTKTFRLSPEEAAMLREGADRFGMSESGWFRYLIRVGLTRVNVTIKTEKVKP